MRDDPIDLWQSWRRWAGDPRIDAAIGDLYTRLDAAVAEREPTCWVSGRCCRFDQFGHRLYVTGLEIARFLSRLPDDQRRHPDAAETPGACPHQINGLCSTHAVRPMGCRVFFCQHGTEDWQQALYEQYLEELRGLHEAHEIPYRYMDWIAGLREAVQQAGR